MRCPDPENSVGTTYERAGKPLCEPPNPERPPPELGKPVL